MEIYVQIAQISAGIVAIVALFFTSTTFVRGRNTTGVNFLLTLNDKLNQEKTYSLYVKLREGNSSLNWPDVDELLGLYEISFYAVRDLRISKSSFASLHAVRLKNLFSNELVFQHKLVNEYQHWIPIYDLVDAIAPRARRPLQSLRKLIEGLNGVLVHAPTVSDKREAIYAARSSLLKSL